MQPSSPRQNQLRRATDSAFVTGRLTDDKGAFIIVGITKGVYLLDVLVIGFQPLDGRRCVKHVGQEVLRGDRQHEFRGTDFRMVSTDYLATQVIRIGYNRKFQQAPMFLRRSLLPPLLESASARAASPGETRLRGFRRYTHRP
jgi:hypothetical protein